MPIHIMRGEFDYECNDESDWPNFAGSQKNQTIVFCIRLLLEWGRGGARAPIHLSTLYLPPQNAGSALIHSSFT